MVIDHGFGLQSIYGHLSEFLVKKDGVQVNAVEWWDPHWVKDRILSKMGTDLAPAEEASVAERPVAAHKSRKHRR